MARRASRPRSSTSTSLTLHPVLTPPTATMPLFHPRRIAILLCVAVVCVYAEKHAASIASMSIPEIEDKLQVLPLFPSSTTPTDHSTIGMRPRSRPQYLQARHLPSDLHPHLPHLRRPLSRLASRQCPPRNPLHLRAAELPPRAMSTKYRPFLPLRHGRFRCRWSAR